MNISDEAVEAAANAIATMRRNGQADPVELYARTALEAALPHLMAAVLDLADDLTACTLSGDNYMTGRGSGFRMAGTRIRQVLGVESSAGAEE